MKEDRIQRFTPTEVFLHWLNAVLYLILAVTGATMVLSRLLDVETTGRSVVPTIHRIAGIILVFVLGQTFLLSLLTESFRRFWLTLRQCLSWRRTDVFWLLKVPLNMFSGRFVLPPAGRFNPGQKLHILVVFMLLIGFVVSGLGIMLVPGALAPWIIHLLCFVPAAMFLLLHLFLSLVNPETRKALPCIVTGSISPEYAREHHALLLGEADHATSKPYVSWRAALIFLLVIVSICGANVWRHGFAGFQGNISKLVAERGANLMMPGALCESHAADSQTGRCLTCHNLFSAIPSDACLHCHEDTNRIMAGGIGYHGMIRGTCRSCHKEHLGSEGDISRLNAVAFNHALARFALEGKHRELPCENCHTKAEPGGVRQRTRYTGLEFDACSDCHENFHKNTRAADCTKCHVTEGWKQPNLFFAHDRDSRFPLEGRHSEIPCEKCHVTEEAAGVTPKFVLYDIGADCSDCHSDPHNSQFTKSCEFCHSAQGWTGRWLVDAHGSNSSFPLTGKHNTVACIECHHTPGEGAKLAEARFAGMGKECDQCHTDPHGNQFDEGCQTCHSEQGWKGRWLVDAHGPLSSYQLRGKHAAVDCIKCHTPSEAGAPMAQARFVGLSHECVYCHEDPHNGQMRSECNTCHAEQGWVGGSLLFDHELNSEFKMDAIHAVLPCESCHNGADTPVYRPLPAKCELCHDDIVKLQRAEGIPVREQPDPHANRVSCLECHSTTRQYQKPADYAAACRACHNRHYEGLFYNWMKSLHGRESRARILLEHLRERNSSNTEMLERKVNHASRVGFHNIALAVRLWDEILAMRYGDSIRNQADLPNTLKE